MKGNRNQKTTEALVSTIIAGGALMLSDVTDANGDEPDLLAARSFNLRFDVIEAVQGDFNGDGQTDFLVRLQNTSGANAQWSQVILGNEDGTVTPLEAFNEFQLFTTCGDFNKDGHLDCFAFPGQEGVWVSEGVGDGTFLEPVEIATANDWYVGGVRSAVGDFNKDGYLDVATTGVADLFGGGQNEVYIGLNVADGSFGFDVSQVAEPLGSDSNGVIVTEDFNGDGNPDLAVVTEGGIEVLLGNGTGWFESQNFRLELFVAPLQLPFRMIAADMDADGAVDLLATNIADVWFFKGNGDGTFVDRDPGRALVQGGFAISGNAGISDITVGRFNADEYLDIVAIRGGSIFIVTGSSSGAFAGSSNNDGVRSFLGGIGGSRVLAGDYNGDGLNDIASFYRDSNNMGIFLGEEEQIFRAPEPATSTKTSGMAAADIDGDGTTDLATIFNDLLSLYFPGPDGNIDRVSLPVDPLQRVVSVGRINDDSIPDLIISGSAGTKIFLGEGGRTFGEAIDSSIIASFIAPVVVDFDDDGLSDVAMVRNTGLHVYRGNGDGSFAEEVVHAAGRGPSSAAWGDIDQDGNIDFVVGNEDDDDATVLWGDGAGGFPDSIDLRAENRPLDVEITDLNGDGFPDVLVMSYGGTSISSGSRPGSVTVHLSNGDRTFQFRVSYPLAFGSYAMEVVDFNRDGFLDVVSAQSEGAEVAVMLGNGDGTFQQSRSYLSGSGNGLAVLDMNGDRGVDVVVNSGTTRFLVLENACSFAPVELSLFAERSGGMLKLSWPEAAPEGAGLQSNGDLSGAGWEDLMIEPVVSEGRKEVMVPIEGNARFFRLLLPE